MSMIRSSFAAVVAILCASISGCAVDPDAAGSTVVRAEYQTGSSIPRKQNSFRSDAKIVNPADAQRFEDEMALRSAARPFTP